LIESNDFQNLIIGAQPELERIVFQPVITLGDEGNGKNRGIRIVIDLFSSWQLL